MKKTAISLALVLAMLVTTVLVAAPVSAANVEHTGNHCVCNNGAVDMGSHTACATGEWTALTNANWANIATGGQFYLAEDITEATRIDIEEGVELTLCLNGNTVTTGNNKLFVVSNGALNVTDCRGSGKINSKYDTSSAGLTGGGTVFHILTSSGVVNIFGGTYNANKEAQEKGYGGLAAVQNGMMNIYNGTLNGRKAQMGCVLYVAGSAEAEATINMYGGIVQDGTSTDRGGNVFINSYAVMNVFGGTIQNGNCTNNAANKGGGNIYVSGTSASNAGQLNVFGGSIIGGESADKGSNIYVHYFGAAHLYGGAVIGGNAGVNSIETGVSTSGTIGTVNLHGGYVQLIEGTDFTANATKYNIDTTANPYNNPLVIDLNGKTLSSTTTAITGKIGLADSTVTAGSSVTANVDIEGFGLANVEQVVNSPAGRYITLEKDGVLSIHRIYVGFDTIQLKKGDDNTVAMNYITNFKMDDDVKALLVNNNKTGNYALGCQFGVGGLTSPYLGYNKDAFKANITTQVNAILGGETADDVAVATKICAQTFVNLQIGDDVVTIYSNIYEYSLQDVIDALDAVEDLEAKDAAAAALLADIKTLYPALFN